MIFRHRRLALVLSILVLAAFPLLGTPAFSSEAKALSCDTLFSPSVKEVATAADGRSPIRAVSPAKGSLEARHPGVILAFVEVRAAAIAAHERFLEFENRNRLKTDLKSVATKLRDLKTRFELGAVFGEGVIALEKNIFKMDQSFLSSARKTAIESELIQLESHIWELAVASLFSGHQLLLNQKLSDLYPVEFKKLSREDRRRIDREIDIAILKEDGSWEWIEVKDWSLKSALSVYPQDKLFKQSLSQSSAREAFRNLRINLVLVMKYSLPEDVFASYRLNTRYDQFVFLFPDATVEQRIAMDVPPRAIWRLQEQRKGRIP